MCLSWWILVMLTWQRFCPGSSRMSPYQPAGLCLYQQTRCLQSHPSPSQGPLQPHLHHTCRYLLALTSFRPTQKSIAVRPSGAVSALQGCSQWQTGRSSGSQLHMGFWGGGGGSGGILAYISKSTRTVTWLPKFRNPGWMQRSALCWK